jgi:SAM-dependent methyltransferase
MDPQNSNGASPCNPELRVSSKSTAFYDRKADSLVKRYESMSFEDVHHSILDLIPHPPASVLDVGAGSGRDAAALAARRLTVFAVEPSKLMRYQAQRIHRGRPAGIVWLDDNLPHLSVVKRLGRKFDFILVSAVWMHIPHSERPAALRTLARLLKPNGTLVVTLRYGRIDPVRRFFAAPAEELLGLTDECALRVLRVTDLDTDRLQRRIVSWKTVVLTHNCPCDER